MVKTQGPACRRRILLAGGGRRRFCRRRCWIDIVHRDASEGVVEAQPVAIMPQAVVGQSELEQSGPERGGSGAMRRGAGPGGRQTQCHRLKLLETQKLQWLAVGRGGMRSNGRTGKPGSTCEGSSWNLVNLVVLTILPKATGVGAARCVARQLAQGPSAAVAGTAAGRAF